MADVLFTPTESEATDRRIRRDFEAGRLIRIARGLYVESGEPIEEIVRRNWYKIIGRLVPDGVATDRTGMDSRPWRDRSSGAPVGDAYVFVSAPRTRDVIKLPGLVINIREGIGPVEGDIPYLGFFLAGPIRTLLDNLTPSRSRGGPARTVGQAAVEAKLDSLCSTHGAEHLNYVRDQARHLAPLIGRDEEFTILDGRIGALLRTREAKLVTKQGRARAAGRPLDPDCVGRLVKLAHYLQSRAPQMIEDRDTTPDRRMAGAFIEAYFSNFIEGTEFAVAEAVEIVFEGKMPESRPEDGHDVLETYLQLVDLGSRSSIGVGPDEFIDEIRERHRTLMKARPSVRPGMFKERSNRAGDTLFVAPDLVDGTLREGVNILQSLSEPFPRGLLLHFLLSDVHPFNDGNGRLSRIMMTKELVSAGLSRIVVPTVFRSDYLDALRALSRRGEPSIFVRSLEFCQRVSAACSEATAEAAIATWARSYAFCEDARHARLSMPNSALMIEERLGTPAPADYWAAIEHEGVGLRL